MYVVWMDEKEKLNFLRRLERDDLDISLDAILREIGNQNSVGGNTESLWYVIHDLYDAYKKDFDKERAIDKDYVERAKRDFEEHGTKETSEEKDSQEE
jgi:hypothetical protein